MLSTFYLGKKRKRGFLLGIIGNLAFMAFGIMAESAANVVANGTYLILNARGWWKWKEEPPRDDDDHANVCRAAQEKHPPRAASAARG